MAVANNLSWRRRHERPHSDNPRRTCQRTGTCPRARHATLACHRHRFRLPSTSFWRRRFRMTSLTSNPVKRPHTDQAQVEVPADPDMVVRGKRLQHRLCSRAGARRRRPWSGHRVASPRPRHHVAPAPTSVDGNLPPTLGPAPGQRPDPGAEPVPPPPRHPSTWRAHARPCRALHPASSPSAPLARHGASRLRPADRDMTRDANTVQNPLYGESGSPPRVRPNGAFIE